MKKLLSVFIITSFFSAFVSAQMPIKTLVQILKAEDELRFDKTLEDLMKSADANIRRRAALASGRIGNEAAITFLVNLLETDKDVNVRETAAFALGEIESIKAADAVLNNLRTLKNSGAILARLVEAAGKIAAANAKNEKSKLLGEAILETIAFETKKRSVPDKKVIEFGLTAALRARPAEAEKTVVLFAKGYSPQIRANALNTLARLRAKNANEIARELLQKDADAIVRANSARVLGAAEDKKAANLLLEAATKDKDSRVRVSATRALGSLKDASVADDLLNYGDTLLANYKKDQKPNFTPIEKSEILEVATTLSRILPNTNNRKAVEFLQDFRQADNFISPEVEIALARIAPKIYVESLENAPEKTFGENWQTSSAAFQGLGEIANLESNDENNEIKTQVRVLLAQLISGWVNSDEEAKSANNAAMAVPDLIRAFAAFKSENTSGVLRPMLEIERDVFIRAAIAEILGEQPANKENIEALQNVFEKSLVSDKNDNDAQFSILSALVKLDKTKAVSSLELALRSHDFLLRRYAANLIKQNDLTNDFPNLEKQVGTVKKYNPLIGSKLGQILNTDADYTRAASRKNRSVRAILQTEKGSFTIDLMPEDAPLTVDNFIKLAKSRYFNGLAVHRVVPNFVMQDGDPRGDGNGGPGWQIRCEINMIEYSRGTVGMALSGKDTGGSQWFVTHSPQPHLDGGYTVFGRVPESDMKIVDSIVRGDKILNVRIIESANRRKS